MKNEIIYLGYLPLTQKVADDFCMLTLSKHGYNIIYWDLSSLFFKRVIPQSLSFVDDIKIVKVSAYSELAKLIKLHSNSLYIILMSFNGLLLRLFIYLNRYDCKTMTFNLCSIPFHLLSEKKSLLHKLSKIKMRNIINKFNFELMLFLIQHQYLRYFDYILTSGTMGDTYVRELVNKNLICLNNTRVLYFNTTDYNTFINTNGHGLVLDYSYILFIDEYYPFHPDVLLFSGKSKLDPDAYFKQLNATFDVFEEKYSLPVVIAAHPKAVKYKEKNYFNGRVVLFDKTASLVAKSKFVISHDSTALNYALFNMKPIVLLKSKTIQKALPENYNVINNLSKFLNSYLYDMDNIVPDKLQNAIVLTDNQRYLYTSLINEYHKAKNITQSNEKLMKQYVEQIFNE